ncbi:MAG: VWA domain-containing protein [Holophagales bacterium]|nr:VWA domain-containing protein [Holophagales bacterium]
MTAPPVCGLLVRGVPVPLEGVSVEAELRGFAARVTLSQRFRNTETTPIEATYVFPLDEGAAVCAFEALVDGRVVAGTVMEKEKAFEAYDEAIAAGNGAFLLDEEKPDVFTVSVGNLPPGKEVVVKITTVSELAAEGDALRFVLPTTVSPRYAPAEDRRGVGRTPEEALNPPRAFQVPYGLSLRVSLDMPSAIRGVESPSHPVSIDLDGARGTVTLATRETALDRDFVLTVRLAEARPANVLVERAPDGTRVAMLTFVPHFGGADGALAGSPKGEVVFLVDRSGSMEGTSIAEARNALQLCLRSLAPGLLFNVVGFGNHHETLFPGSRPYDEASLAEASRHVSELKADLGGTEILSPLRAILEAPLVEGMPRQLFVLTDGEVSNTEAVLALVRANAGTTRVFTFGIGAGASLHLVKGMARAGGGEAELIAPGERVEGKVMRQLARALAPALGDVRVDWGGAKVMQAPHAVPPVFDGGRLVVYGFLEGDAACDVVLRGKGPGGDLAVGLRLETAGAPEGKLLATLAARTLIRDLEEGASPLHTRRGSLQGRVTRDTVKEEIVRLGVTYGLASRETSYVAVEEREVPVHGEMVLRKVPIALTRGWGGVAEAEMLADSGVCYSMAPPAAPSPSAPQYSGRALTAREDFSMEMEERSAPKLKKGAPPKKSFIASFPDALRRIARDAAPVPEPTPAPSSLRPLDLLVALQKADGSWELTEELAAALGKKLPDLEKTLASSKGEPARRAWATALALAWLAKNAPAEKDEWTLLARKARTWLDASGAAAPSPAGWLAMAEAEIAR